MAKFAEYCNMNLERTRKRLDIQSLCIFYYDNICLFLFRDFIPSRDEVIACLVRNHIFYYTAVHLSIHLFIHSFIHPFIHYPSIYPSIHPFIHLFIHLAVNF